MVGGNVETSQRIVDVILGALGIAAASQGTMNNLLFGNGTSGYYETICGGAGATPEADGADAVHTHMTNTRATDPEVLEQRYPVRLWEFSIRRGSGGAGLRRGGDGAVRRIEFLADLKVSLLTQRRGPYAPYSLEGGQAGALGHNRSLRRRSDGSPPGRRQFHRPSRRRAHHSDPRGRRVRKAAHIILSILGFWKQSPKQPFIDSRISNATV